MVQGTVVKHPQGQDIVGGAQGAAVEHPQGRMYMEVGIDEWHKDPTSATHNLIKLLLVVWGEPENADIFSRKEYREHQGKIKCVAVL